MHLRALAKLPDLTVLNLVAMEWDDACVTPGLGWLVARLPHLRIFQCTIARAGALAVFPVLLK